MVGDKLELAGAKRLPTWRHRGRPRAARGRRHAGLDTPTCCGCFRLHFQRPLHLLPKYCINMPPVSKLVTNNATHRKLHAVRLHD